MKVASLKLVCFSPTGTSRTVIQGIARGMNPGTAELSYNEQVFADAQGS